ncbi:MAG: hypothetical protein LBQ87_07965 [Candidatus Fibromonas sp.]|jgi:hypothetical protein|nr:hypothetical protein [Candidatus Fibromonas sp.]
MTTSKSFVKSETDRIYAEYEQSKASNSKSAHANHSKKATVGAFNRASSSLIGDFIKATRGV